MFSLTDNLLTVVFELKDTKFSSGNNTKICQGLRMLVTVDGNPPPEGFSATVTIFGMNNQDMQLIASMSRILSQSTTVQIYAADSRNAYAAIFNGTIFDARITYNNMPDVALEVVAFSSSSLKGIQYPPVSYKNNVKAQDILHGMASYAKIDFENNDVDELITNCYLTDSVATNIDTICTNKNIRYSIENNKLIIWKNKRNNAIPLINTANGLIGYPTSGVTGIYFSCIYNPNIRFGGFVDLESNFKQCTGRFYVLSLVHNLSYMQPNGQWFSTVQAYPTGDVMSMGVK